MDVVRYLVTSALPYANGPIHFGHVAGAYLPADVWVRYRRLRGDEVLFLCGTDEHGVAITIAAERAGVGYREFVDRWHEEIRETLRRFRIGFDHFSGTSRCRHHAPLAQAFFTNLHRGGYVLDREEKQWFCPKDQMFLADRYLEGTCPKCGGSARGDECRQCGQWLDALELKDARCKICGSAPEIRSTRHWYLDLPKLCRERIGAWFEGKARRAGGPKEDPEVWKPNVAAFVANMLADLKPRAITRDLRWGVPLPLPGSEGKVLYVWFDAPIGYISATAEWAERNGRDPETWKEWWRAREDTRIVHFIGKDNIGFHTIVFPAMLHGQGEAFGAPLALPWNVPAMEFLNLEGAKFSTSGGWYVPLDDFFERYPADAIRWTLLQNLPETADAEFTWADFQRRVNGELADVVGNFASRVLRFLEAHFDHRVPRTMGEPDPGDLAGIEEAQRQVARGIVRSLEAFRFREAAGAWLAIARQGNMAFDYQRPWSHIRDRKPRAAHTLAACVRILEILAATGAPFLPDLSERLWRMLGVDEEKTPRSWPKEDFSDLPDLRGKRIGHVENLFRKIEDAEIAAEDLRLRERAAPVASPGKAPMTTEPSLPSPPLPPVGKPEISYEEFSKLDLRVGRIALAERVPKAEKLLRLEVEIDGTGERRQVLAGIAKVYDPSTLVGRRVVVLANLASKKMMGLESRGMVLAAEGPDGPCLLLPDREVAVGVTVK
ncbi:MAG TPA: methionine--tRNA ligase [Planctomycetota bacterium]|nr:methionine--tRNA ligase [Planctomycetota bacterium]